MTRFERLGRRRLLRATLAGACGLALGRPSLAQTSPVSFSKTALADDLAVIGGAGAHVIVLSRPDALLLVDGGLAERSAALLDYLAAEWPGRRVEALFNTNWGWEHTGSNQALRRAGAKIIAHENTKLWLGNDFTIDWQNDRVHSPCPADALPTDTFYSGKRELTFGTVPVEYGYFAQAHTDGDLYVFFPQHDVLVASDLLSVGEYPVVDYVTGGWLGGMANAAKGLLEIAGPATRIVPAAGPVQNRAALAKYQQMCAALKDRLGGMIKSGMSLQEVIAAAPTGDYDGDWGDPHLFLKLAYKGLWGHVRELGGVL